MPFIRTYIPWSGLMIELHILCSIIKYVYVSATHTYVCTYVVPSQPLPKLTLGAVWLTHIPTNVKAWGPYLDSTCSPQGESAEATGVLRKVIKM